MIGIDSEKDNKKQRNPCNPCQKGRYGIMKQRRSGRQGCNPAGESPAVSVARVGYVVMPHPGAGNQPGYAWCKRPGCSKDLVL